MLKLQNIISSCLLIFGALVFNTLSITTAFTADPTKIQVLTYNDANKDGDSDGNTEARMPADVALYVEGNLIKEITTSFNTVELESKNDVLAELDENTPYIVCQKVPNDYSYSGISNANDPKGEGRPCQSGTVNSTNSNNGFVRLFFFNKPDPIISIVSFEESTGRYIV